MSEINERRLLTGFQHPYITLKGHLVEFKTVNKFRDDYNLATQTSNDTILPSTVPRRPGRVRIGETTGKGWKQSLRTPVAINQKNNRANDLYQEEQFELFPDRLIPVFFRTFFLYLSLKKKSGNFTNLNYLNNYPLKKKTHKFYFKYNTFNIH